MIVIKIKSEDYCVLFMSSTPHENKMRLKEKD